jgi:hypothetical protein
MADFPRRLPTIAPLSTAFKIMLMAH